MVIPGFRFRKQQPADLLRRHGEPVMLAGGHWLYRTGEPSDAVFLVVSGRVRVRAEVNGVEQTVREVGPGEILGALGVYSDTPRSTSALAVRDTRLLRVDQERFVGLMLKHPEALWAFGQLCLDNLSARQQAGQPRRDRQSVRTIAILPADPDLPAESLGVALEQELAQWGAVKRVSAITVDAHLGAGRSATPTQDLPAHAELMTWLDRLEAEHRFVIYQADDGADQAWTRRCLRQADRVLILARVDRKPRLLPVLAALNDDDEIAATETECVFLNPAGGSGHLTPMTWRDINGASWHHWYTPDDPRSAPRLARLLTGRATGLVLGGGGARGAAHIGLLRVLDRLGLDVDLIGGTSIGAIMGGMVAQGWDVQRVNEVFDDLFVHHNYLNDYTVPRVSLLAGKKMRRALDQALGPVRIEMLPLPYFCVSTNLTKGCSQIHTRGPLSLWAGASASVPGVAPPTVYQDDLLVDGATLNNVPTDIMHGWGRGQIIASDVTAAERLDITGEQHGDDEPELLQRHGRDMNIFKILFRSATLLSPEQRRERAARADLYLQMPVGGMGMFDWDAVHALIPAAEDYAERELTAWLEARAPE